MAQGDRTVTPDYHDGPVGRHAKDRGRFHLLSTARVPVPNAICGFYPKRPWSVVYASAKRKDSVCPKCMKALAEGFA